MSRAVETHEQATGGTCTWRLVLANGEYVYSVDPKLAGCTWRFVLANGEYVYSVDPKLAGCTWRFVLANGEYVYSVDPKLAGYDRNSAHLWLSQEAALESARKSSWIGVGARAERARP